MKRIQLSAIALALLLAACQSPRQLHSSDAPSPTASAAAEPDGTNRTSGEEQPPASADGGAGQVPDPSEADWQRGDLIRELYAEAPYSAVYSPMLDTYLIACGLYLDFGGGYLFAPDMGVDYGETVDHFSQHRDHPFVQGLGEYVDTQNAYAPMDVLYYLTQYAVSRSETGMGVLGVRCDSFPSDEAFSAFLAELRGFYLDTGAEAFFAESGLHRQLEQAVSGELGSLPVGAYLAAAERYTGTGEHLPGGAPRYRSLLSVYKSPYNATFHQYGMGSAAYLVSLQSPLGWNGGLDMTNTVETAVHESLHPFVNPGVEARQNLVNTLADGKSPGDYASPGYTGMPWHRIADEALVRAVQARIYREVDGDDGAALAMLDKETGAGWANLHALYEQLGDYEQSRGQYPTLDDYLPELLPLFFGEPAPQP